MKRSEIRDEVFKMLFRVDFQGVSDMPEQFDIFVNGDIIDDTPDLMSEAEKTEIKERTEMILPLIEEIDDRINSLIEGWNTKRVGKVELTILRLAVYEAFYDENIPGKVAINEAVELAKKYAGETAAAFVNGVLGRIVRAE